MPTTLVFPHLVSPPLPSPSILLSSPSSLPLRPTFPPEWRLTPWPALLRGPRSERKVQQNRRGARRRAMRKKTIAVSQSVFRLALQRRGAPALSVRYAMRHMRVRGLDLAGLPHVFAPSMHGGPSRGTACIQHRAANAGRLTVFMRSCRRANPEPHYSLAHSSAPCRSSSAGRRLR